MAIPNMWRTKKQRYSLQGDVCQHCERAIFPPREICPHCHKPMQATQVIQMTAVRGAPSFDFAALMQSATVPSAAMVGDD
jgi:predicted amidophosphoribosyltransferase